MWYSSDHKQLNARSRLTRKGGTSARKRSVQRLRARRYCLRVPYESVRMRVQVGVCIQ